MNDKDNAVPVMRSIDQVLADAEKRGLSDWDEVLEEEEQARVSFLKPVLLGLGTIVIGIGGFFLWASSMDIAAASIAGGRIIVQTQTKTIMHAEGGVLAELAVAEGQEVQAGDVLLRLDVTRSQSRADQLRSTVFGLKVRLARLEAETRGKETFQYPSDEATLTDEQQRIIDAHTDFFNQRRQAYRDRVGLQENLIEQLATQRDELLGRQSSFKVQLAIAAADMDRLGALLKSGLAVVEKVSEARRRYQELQADVTAVAQQIIQNGQKVTEAKLNIASYLTERNRESADQLQQTQAELAMAEGDLVTAEDVVVKSVVRAPQAGTVANIRFFTPGSAITPSQPILDLVPLERPMLVEAKVRAADIDSVRVGLPTEIRLTAFSQETLTPLRGKIVYVEANSQIDPNTGISYYIVRADIDAASLSQNKGTFLYPGMAAEMFILNGSRRVITYLAEPFVEAFRRSFREQ